MKSCTIELCKQKYYASGKCRSHYRILTGESSKRWQKIKNDAFLYARMRKNHKKWEDKMRGTVYIKEKNRKAAYKLYHKDGRRKAYLKNWKQKLSIEKLQEYRKKDNYTRQFGSWQIREKVIQRDVEKCVKCGIGREEHKQRWNQDLHVDHIDNYGRNVIKEAKNNNLENLQTLCIRCHRSKSAKEQKDLKRLEVLFYGKDFTNELKEQIRELVHRKCQKCGKEESKLKRKLDIHHLDGNKWNNKKENLRALCLDCHLKVESEDRVKSTKEFIPNM